MTEQLSMAGRLVQVAAITAITAVLMLMLAIIGGIVWWAVVFIAS